MKGFVPTPERIVDVMVDRLFQRRRPKSSDSVLDPGCGTGPFISGIIRWCHRNSTRLPRILGIEQDKGRAKEAREKFAKHPSVEILCEDFLGRFGERKFEYIIGNPPYVPITKLTESEKVSYRELFSTATNRFDLYFLFFERALGCLKTGGRLVFITPEKFLYVDSASSLRGLLSQLQIEEIRLIKEEAFGSLVTYPAISVIDHEAPTKPARIIDRKGKSAAVELPRDGSSWLSALNGKARTGTDTLEDVSLRISCGVATGADHVYVRRTSDLPKRLQVWAHPTISGTQLAKTNGRLLIEDVMLVPYDKTGELKPLQRLGALQQYLQAKENRDALMKRTCVRRKPWYAFHETPPMEEALRPKILCRDITDEPRFWLDAHGSILPRHSVYYIVPKDSNRLPDLVEYLNSSSARRWLLRECQRAANGYIRLQSAVLRRLPLPHGLVG